MDAVLEKVCKHLGVEIPHYETRDDPTKRTGYDQEWTIPADLTKNVEKRYTAKLKAHRESTLKRKSAALIDDKKL